MLIARSGRTEQFHPGRLICLNPSRQGAETPLYYRTLQL
jgi:hypothetical protein